MSKEAGDEVRRVLKQHGRLSADVDRLDPTVSLYDAGLTSLACVNVMLALEDALDVEFPERLLKRSTFETIESLTAALSGLAQVSI